MSDNPDDATNMTGDIIHRFQIDEPDLCELERLLPRMLDRLACAEAQLRQESGTPSDDNRLNVQIRRVQKIIMDVRWDYRPYVGITTIPDY